MNPRAILSFLAAGALLATPAIASAAEPALSATVIPGQEIDITGTDFPADADVLLAILRNGADAGTQTPKTDATGTFTATIDAGPGNGGVYTVTATSGSATAVVEALAVETAGAEGLQSSPPPTDTTSAASSKPALADGRTIGLLAILMGTLLLAANRRRRVIESKSQGRKSVSEIQPR